ncbi:hypothetical protein BDV26DRAFT_292309 [Aspergillus bertholletiae]|uniref:Meiosis protein SPO22/ZIP4 like-domain-containing protein n=1 Tax=Aspergillus bertholletiae TaxID=1226010 RepID=A0A5N7B9B2_9EURO|nr:hypothetical protein BDV26DRAFT_292309 [Aspergillus bertholletiae]
MGLRNASSVLIGYTEFAEELLLRMQNNAHEAAVLMTNALRSLDEHLDHFPLPTAPPTAIRDQLAARGAKLWNISTQMRLIMGNITLLSAFALFILDCVTPSQGPGILIYDTLQISGQQVLMQGLGSQRVLEAALKAVQSCTERGLIELSQKIVGMVAVRLDRLERSTDGFDKAQIVSVTAGYYMVRVHLAWLQGRPDIADHLFLKLPTIATACGQRRISELCYKIGSFALNDRHYDNAAKWLERALTAWEFYKSNVSHGIDDDGLLILHALIRANLNLDSSLAKERLQKALDLIIKKYPYKFAVKALQLEILGREGRSNGNEYLQILRDMLGILKPNEAELKTASFYVQILQQLLVEKLAASGQQEWTERIFIILVWTLTNNRLHLQNSSSVLCDTTKRMVECGQGLLSDDATNACLILIWKYVDVVSSKGNFRVAEHWCSFVLEESMFRLSSENKTIFTRRYLACISDSLNMCGADKLFDRMPDKYRRCPTALYLTYKAALNNKDFPQGHSNLDLLCQLGASGRTYLLPCAAEALRSGHTLLAAKCLQYVIDHLHDSVPEGKYIASLIIAVCCLLSAQIGKAGNLKEDDELLAQVIRVLEAAYKNDQTIAFSATELEWLSRRSYNIAIQARLCDARLVLRLLDLSMQFIDLQRKTMASEKQCRLWQQYLYCDILKIDRIIIEARKEIEPFMKACLIRSPTFAQHFRSYAWNPAQREITTAHHSEWVQHYRNILSVDLECALFFKKWGHASSIIEESKSIIDDKLCSIFLDSILRCEASVIDIVKVIEKIVHVLCTTASPYLEAATVRATLPHYIHTFFQLSLDASDYCLAELALDQALASACDLCSKDSRYPSDEIQWMATVAFNRAVDLYLLSKSGDCQRWAAKAIKLVDLGEKDCEMLGALLREQLKKLS